MSIIPRKIYCKNCGHVWNTKVKKPQCSRCNKRDSEPISNFDLSDLSDKVTKQDKDIRKFKNSVQKSDKELSTHLLDLEMRHLSLVEAINSIVNKPNYSNIVVNNTRELKTIKQAIGVLGIVIIYYVLLYVFF